MESIKEIVKEYHRLKNEIRHVENELKKPDCPNPITGEQYLARLEDKFDEAEEKIDRFRREAVGRTGYTIRGTKFRGTNSANMDELRKKAEELRSCMRTAAQKDKAEDHAGAELMRKRADEYAHQMSMIRTAGHRTMTTDSMLMIGKGKSDVTPTKKKSVSLPGVSGWSAKQRTRLDRIEKKLNDISERCKKLETRGDGSLLVKRPIGPVKR